MDLGRELEMENAKDRCHPLLLYEVHKEENHPNFRDKRVWIERKIGARWVVLADDQVEHRVGKGGNRQMWKSSK